MSEDVTQSNWIDALVELGGPGVQKMEDIGFASFMTLELLSLASALFIFLLYQRFFGSRATGSRINRAFPLIGISVTTIFIAIQFSLPLSLGLLGALSIVRFRTPIKEPEEIGFILLVIAASLCCATFNLMLLGVLLATGVLALLILEAGRLFQRKASAGVFVVSLPTAEYDDKSGEILGLLSRSLSAGKLDGISQNGESSTISYSFPSLGEDALVNLSTEVRRLAENANVNAFYGRPE